MYILKTKNANKKQLTKNNNQAKNVRRIQTAWKNEKSKARKMMEKRDSQLPNVIH